LWSDDVADTEISRTNCGTACKEATFKNTAIGGSLEFGKNQELPYEWFIEPQFQGALTKIAGDAYITDTGITVRQRSGAVGRARAGFRFGRDFETGKLGILHVYLKAHYGYQWTKGGHLDVRSPVGQAEHYAPTIKGYTLEGGLGMAWLVNRRTQVYFDYATTQADYYIKPYGLNLGARYMW
jgi:outer membrane autotransporter protein